MSTGVDLEGEGDTLEPSSVVWMGCIKGNTQRQNKSLQNYILNSLGAK